jgi:lambda family phage portal protein
MAKAGFLARLRGAFAAMRGVTSMPSAEPKQSQHTRVIRGRYDAAQTDAENRKHWSQADALSPLAANSQAVRRVLRNRSRYEVANNSYARGILNTRANHVIGTGPRLQVETGDTEADAFIERSFAKWSKAVRLGSKLRTMQLAKMQDGEAFAVMTTNENLPHPVKLDLQLVECDRVTNPYAAAEFLPGKVDGIEYDEAGNPTIFHILRYHPGDYIVYDPLASDAVAADKVIHWFRCDRPGQFRGIPETTPSLPLYAYLRRYTLSTIAASETAANLSATLESQMLPEDDSDIGTPFDEMEIVRNSFVTLPVGYKMNQFKPEQPVTGYSEFKHEILNEIARPFDMPYNIAACNSSGYNYSSGRLDIQTYWRSVGIEETDCEDVALCRIVTEFLTELLLIKAFAQRLDGLAPFDEWNLGWFWDGQESIDENKDATADETNLSTGATTLSQIWASKGGDWRQGLRQIAIELAEKKKLEEEFGITFPSGQSTAPPPQDNPSDNAPPPPSPSKQGGKRVAA